MEQLLECAIAPHLRVERTRPVSTPDEYAPPYPAYCARFPQSIDNLVMAIFGAQSKPNATLQLKDVAPVLNFVKDSSQPAKPSYWDIASVRDNSGAHNLVVIAYWSSKASYNEWCQSSGFENWFDGLSPEKEALGWFREVFFPSVKTFETVFSDNEVPEGAARMREGVSGPVREHVYWGSMRDRMALSQTEPMNGQPWEKPSAKEEDDKPAEKKRIKVPGRRNLCVIRSGQDWSNTTPHEREKYLNTMHPVLIRGMDFLRDNGDEVGCFECRFMQVHNEDESSFEPKADANGEAMDKESSTDRTFGLGYFNDMASLEKWSKEHQTHLNIFGRFLQYAAELENNVSLRLFHEVLVLEEPDQQLFEYVGCHKGTGMLSAVAGAN